MTWTGMVILVLLGILVGFIGVGGALFANDPNPRTAKVLIATFAAGMAILGIAISVTAFRRGQWWAWLALWYYPVFFVIHVVAFGDIVPDGVFAVLAVIALLLAMPRGALSSRDAG
jgi:hypothetical protein